MIYGLQEPLLLENLTVVSRDEDFLRIKQAQNLFLESWIA